MTQALPPHLDLDALADARAGVADAAHTEHVASCTSCSSRLAELEAAEAGVLAALRALPDPALPDGLADRLAAALRAEAPLTAARPEPAGTVTPLPARTDRRRRLLPAAAAAVLLVSGAGLGYSLVGGPTGGDEGASSDTVAGGAAGGGTTGAPRSSSGTDYADPTAVSGVLPAVLAGSAGAVVADGAAASTERGAPAAGSTGSESADSVAGAPAPAVAAMTADPLERLRSPEGLADCLAAVLPPEEPDVQPRALDYAQFKGQPALAVVLPDPDPAKLSVFVVGAGCTSADAQVLGFFRLDAP